MHTQKGCRCYCCFSKRGLFFWLVRGEGTSAQSVPKVPNEHASSSGSENEVRGGAAAGAFPQLLQSSRSHRTRLSLACANQTCAGGGATSGGKTEPAPPTDPLEGHAPTHLPLRVFGPAAALPAPAAAAVLALDDGAQTLPHGAQLGERFGHRVEVTLVARVGARGTEGRVLRPPLTPRFRGRKVNTDGG